MNLFNPLEMILGDRISIEKLDKLIALLDVIDYDAETKTLTVDSDITVVIKGEYKMDVDKHLRINSNYMEMDEDLGIPFSVLINSPEAEFAEMQKNLRNILGEPTEGDCGCNKHGE
jgi:hypothetical protein